MSSIHVPVRFAGFGLCIAGLLVSILCLPLSLWWGWPAAFFGALSALGAYDLLQTRRAVSRNYPVLAHLRYFLESIGPEIRQYFIEADTDERPFSREQRSVVYQRAKNVLDKRPFGTLQNVYAEGYEWINHSVAPTEPDPKTFRVTVGRDCPLPYRASVFNISAMSFGSLSANAILALNKGAVMGGFYHDTGEGSISRYHTRHGGDLMWEIGSGYFGCRDQHGRFDETLFRDNAVREQVRLIEIKLSQGAKPGHGGILPAAKVTPEIAEARHVPMGADVVSPPAHSAFRTPIELMRFMTRLREASGGKPVGFKLAVGHPWEWFAMVKAMLETEELPDFIVVDGGEGGTGAAPLEFINRLGMPLDDALLLVHNTLVGAGLRDRLHIGAAGKVTSSFKIARTMALGADWCNAARGFMFALGCIQSLSCHTDHCPTGVATQDPYRAGALDVRDKSVRVANFHANTLKALAGLLSAAGLEQPWQIRPSHLLRRTADGEVRSFDELYPFLEAGELLRRTPSQAVYQRYWAQASARRFAPPAAA